MLAADTNVLSHAGRTLALVEGEVASYELTDELNRLDDRPQEFPRIDERLLGRPHRYGYAMQAASGTGAIAVEAVLKHDLRQGRTTERRLGRHRQPGEFVFIPNTSDAAEDDGVLMGFVYDASTNRSDLILLDAATLETIAAIHLPDRVPHGFHGNWSPSPA